MTAVGQDIGGADAPWIVGDDKTLVFACTDQATGTVLSMAGATARWGLFAELSGLEVATTASIAKSTGSGVSINTPVAGSITVEIAASDTAGLAPGRYRHELELTDSLGKVSTLAHGQVQLTAQRLS